MLAALVLATVLVVLSSIGTAAIPTAALASTAPAASTLHLPGDDVAAAPSRVLIELRSRLLTPQDPLPVALVTTLAALVGLLALGRAMAVDVVQRLRPAIAHASGRAPPAARRHHR